MELIFKKGNAKNSITCRRPDGTATWMEADTFMILHDLTHYVVETCLHIKSGFYGLLAQGLGITDFEKKQKIKPADLPPDGIRAEVLVNLFLTERNDNREIEDFNSEYRELSKKYKLSAETIDDGSLLKVREGVDAIVKKWKALPAGESLVFSFPD